MQAILTFQFVKSLLKRTANSINSKLSVPTIVLLTTVLASCGGNQVGLEADIEARVQAILAEMTLEQKVGQMVQGEIRYVTPDDVKNYYLGSVLNGGGTFPNERKDSSVKDWVALADAYYKASMDLSAGGAGIPIIWGTDAVHGHNNVMGATLFPHNIGLGAANDPSLMRKIGEITAREVAVTGIDWVFAPTVAVVKDYRWGRTYEGYSTESSIPSAYASEIIYGIQGDLQELATNHEKVLATAKHFIGDGGTQRGVDQGDTRLSLDELLEIHGQGYYAALQADVQTVMASFNSWNGEKIHGHKQLLTDVLKGQLEFDGIVVSDWDGIGQVEGCSDDSCAQSINAGVDIIMVPKDWKPFLNNTIAQVKSGEISMSRIDDAVTRILRVKLRLGLYEKGLPSSRSAAGKASLMGAAEHRAVAREAVRKSLVLLKNRGQLLPLKPNQHVLVAGDGADNITKQSGGWSITWQGTENANDEFPGATSIYKGIEQAITQIGGSAELSVKGEWVEKPDVAVVVFGENPYAEGQGDIETLAYHGGSKTDLRLIQALRQQGIPVVSVFLSGRPLWVNAEINNSDAFVAAWLPGTEGGGIADVLVADTEGQPRYDFTGRLTFNWPNAEINAEDKTASVQDNLLGVGAGLSYGMAEMLAQNLNEIPLHKYVDASQMIFSGSSKAPWKMIVGDSKNWAQEVSGKSFTSSRGDLKVTVVDGIVQEDSRSLEWSGDHQSQFYWRSQHNVDLTKAAAESSIVYEVTELTADSMTLDIKFGPGYWRFKLVPAPADTEGGDISDADAVVSVIGDWVLRPDAGALAVGPEQGDGGAWWASSVDDVSIRTCLFDDVFSFGADGSFANQMGGATWLEWWQAEGERCGAPIAPHDGVAAATYSYDAAAGTLTIDGLGAHIGLPKVVNGGEISNQDKSIVMTYRIDKRPQHKVIQRMDCNWPCSGSQDVTELFNSVALGEWVQSSISLECFEKAGADLSNINIPLLFTTAGSFAMTIKEVRLASQSAETAVSCNAGG